MAKFFKTDAGIMELANKKFEETGLPQMGINMKVISITKAKEVVKVSKASATTQFLSKDTDIIMVVYEEALDRLPDDFKEKLVEGQLSNVFYDTEKDRLNIDNTPYGDVFRMRKKYTDYVDILEASSIVIAQIAEEEKERKEMEREAKKNKKNKN